MLRTVDEIELRLKKGLETSCVGMKPQRPPLDQVAAMALLHLTPNRQMAFGAFQVLWEASSPNPEDCFASRLGKVFQPETEPLPAILTPTNRGNRSQNILQWEKSLTAEIYAGPFINLKSTAVQGVLSRV